MSIDPAFLRQVSQGDGSAHADLAQLIWNRVVDDEQVVALLKSDDDQIRRAVAWAVADAGRPPAALSHLIEAGVSDSLDAVRCWALFAATSYTEMAPDQVAAFLRPYACDPSPRVQRFVRSVIEAGHRGGEGSPWGRKKGRKIGPTTGSLGASGSVDSVPNTGTEDRQIGTAPRQPECDSPLDIL